MKNLIYLIILFVSCSKPVEKYSGLELQVVNLINQAAKEYAQASSFKKLESLGCKAVPFIIKHMEDYRKLPNKYLELRNYSVNAFEANRIYRPEIMVDALASILNQITGTYFEFIYNGGTMEQRKKEIEQWNNYLKSTIHKNKCN